MSKSKKVKARAMILLHSKSGTYSDYTLQPNATDAHFAKLADEISEHTSILSKVFVLLADAASYDAMVEQAHTAIANDPDYQSIAHHQWLDLVGTVFAAIGITRPKEDKA